MPITRDPYQTFMGQQLDQGKIEDTRERITRYMADQSLTVDSDTDSTKVSQYLTRENKDVYGIDVRDWQMQDATFFAHPMVIYDKSLLRENTIGGFDNFKVVADMRAVVDRDRSGEIRVGDHAKYMSIAARAVMMQWWLAHGTVGPLSSMPVAVPIFAELIGEMLGTIKMELDDAQRLRIWAGIWYYMAHKPSVLTDLKPNDKFDIIKFLNMHMRVSADYVSQVLDCAIAGYDDSTLKVDRDERGTIKHWFALAPIACESVRLEGAMKDIGAFLGMIGRALSTDPLKVEMMGIAFDHPPTFLALVYSAANNFTAKSNELSKIVARPLYRDGISQLTRGISRKLQ